MLKEEFLKVAILMNDSELFGSLIKNKNLNLTWADLEGRTALHWAATTESGYDFIKLLIDRGANPNQKDKQGYTPQDLAKQLGQERNAELLETLSRQLETITHTKSRSSIYSAKSYSIIVIGAGISGITAAHELVQQGYSVTLLEARSRVGGRVETIHLDKGVPVELGCHFLHGPAGNPLTPLFKKFNITMEAANLTQTAVYDSEGKWVDLESLSPFTKILKKKLSQIEKTRLSEASEFKSQTSEEPFAQTLKNMMHKGSLYAPHKKDSLLSYKLGFSQDYMGGNYLITNGYNRLTEGLLEEAQSTDLLEVKLNHVVKRIEDKGNKVLVTVKNQGVLEADAVICTIPLKVLNTIEFDPPLLDNKKTAIERLGMATYEKTILEFDKVFWPEDAHYLAPFDYETDIWRQIINLHHFTHGKTASLMIANLAEKEQLDKSNDALTESALNILKKIFGNKLSKLKFSTVTHWYKDPYSLGSFSYHLEEATLADNMALAEPYGRICFAGEHTSHFPSSMDGAYLSGLQATKDIGHQLNLFK